MFDFGSDSRKEGALPGINDKGLVTFDRKTKKDSYYLYQASWSAEPMVHVASSRFNPRYADTINVTVYSNCSEVELYINNEYYGVQQLAEVDCGIFAWDDVALPKKGVGQAGRNMAVAVGSKDGQVFRDTAVWYHPLNFNTSITSATLPVDNTNHEVVLNITTLRAEDLHTLFTLPQGARMELQAANGQPYPAGLITPGLRLKVTAEDGATITLYKFVRLHLALGKAIIASEAAANGKAELAIDGNAATCWTANSTASDPMPIWLMVDLGKVYMLNKIGIAWFNDPAEPRSYSYSIQTGVNDTTEFAIAVQHRNNTRQGLTEDSLHNQPTRFIEITVSGSSGSYLPAVAEIEAYGWTFTSNKYAISYTEHIISVPIPNEQLSCNEFLSNLHFEGVKNYHMESDIPYITGAEKLVITPTRGATEVFDVFFDDDVIPANDKWFYITFKSGGAVLEDQGNGHKLKTASRVLGKPAQLWKRFGFENSVVLESQLGNKIYFDETNYSTGINRSSGFQIMHVKNGEELRYNVRNALTQWGGQGIDRELGNATLGSLGNALNFEPFVDIVKPSAPKNLSLDMVTESSITVSWNAAADNVGVDGYHVYLNNIMVVEQANTTCKIAGLEANKTYVVQVAAYDAAGNLSVRSEQLTITTQNNTAP
jgi:hypothetical protein